MCCIFVIRQSFRLHPSPKLIEQGMSYVWITVRCSIGKIFFFFQWVTWLSPIEAGVGLLCGIVACVCVCVLISITILFFFFLTSGFLVFYLIDFFGFLYSLLIVLFIVEKFWLYLFFCNESYWLIMVFVNFVVLYLSFLFS